MKVLVLGGTGMAGHTISIYFKEAGHDITAFSRQKLSFCKNINGDIMDFKKLIKIIIEGQYDVIINAVGILNEDAENNKSKAVLINSYLPHFLSDITKSMKTRIIQISTDCVFSGKTGGYTETSQKDGETFYDRSKALGELTNDKDLTFRTSIIGPDINENGIGLFNWFMKQEREINGYTKAIWTGVTTLTLARAMEQAQEENLTGLYNLVNNESISKYELLKLFNNHFRKGELLIRANDMITLDKSLVNKRCDFKFFASNYEQMIIEMKNWIYEHQAIYPHYFQIL